MYFFRGYNYLNAFTVSRADAGGYKVDVDFVMSKRYNFDQNDSSNSVSATWLWALHGLGYGQNFFIRASASTSFLVGAN